MELLAPTGTVAHSGTYSGFLPSVLAAIDHLDILGQPGAYDRINATGATFYGDLQDDLRPPRICRRGCRGMGARFGIYFGRTEPVRTWTDALGARSRHAPALRARLRRARRLLPRLHPPGRAGPRRFLPRPHRRRLRLTLDVVDDVCKELTH